MNNWKPLNTSDPIQLKETTMQLHHAAQFVGMVGKHLVEQQPDDSNTNMEWLESKGVLAGNWVNDNFRVALRSHDLTLMVFNQEMEVVSELALNGKTKQEALEWLKGEVVKFGADGSKLQLKMHYDISSHSTDDGAEFQISVASQLQEMANYRSNGDDLMKQLVKPFQHASPVRIWPHHFDNGCYIPVEFDEKGAAVRSFSIGLAIADPYADEPYFYITTWSAKGDIDYSNLPELKSGGEWNKKDWTGAILKATEIVKYTTADEQAKACHEFLSHGIDIALDLIGHPELKRNEIAQ
jgi:hypothetical protein